MVGIITTEEAQKGFYPTPKKVAEKLLADLNWWKIDTILEPSAGKGNLVTEMSEQFFRPLYSPYKSSYHTLSVDCIELDPHLRSILFYEFCGQKLVELQQEHGQLQGKSQRYDTPTRSYGHLTDEERSHKDALHYDIKRLENTFVHIVHDDFLTFDSRKQYSLIVMNPPFHNGDEHLLKAIQIQSRSGGEIRCVLNAETLRNPHTNKRRHLAKLLLELEAEVEFISDAFLDAERPTDVEVAIIKLTIPVPQHNSEFYDRMKTAARLDDTPIEEVTDLTVSDFVERIVTQYNVEVDSGLALIREYKAMLPYIQPSLNKKESYASPILQMSVGEPGRCATLSENKYVEAVRMKYWEALFTNEAFVGQLTSTLRDKYHKEVGCLSAYDFTVFNIRQVMLQMNAEMGKGIEDAIVKLFDRMTAQHTWFPDGCKNVHYFNGWKSNKAHKVNKKVILPVNGMFSDPYYIQKQGVLNVRTAEDTISDIEKVFDYLDGNMTASVSLRGVLSEASLAGKTKNIPCKYFSVSLFKKGTMHITFHNQELLDRFNIYCCGKKGWLPPSYGRTQYSDMAPEEQSVVDGFDGDGAEGSGAAAYAKVLRRPGYYLGAPGNNMPALMAAV